MIPDSETLSCTSETVLSAGETPQPRAPFRDNPFRDIHAQSPMRFINRELSWLQFNFRVMEEAYNPAHPLLERVRFLSISASNLDEFYMVRVAGLKAQVMSGVQSNSPDLLTPAQQLEKINTLVLDLLEKQRKCLFDLLKELKKVGISVVGPESISEKDRNFLGEKFIQEIFPVLSPVAVDPSHPFPFIPNLGFGLIFEMKNPEMEEALVAIVILPQHLNRMIRLPGEDRVRYILLEDVVRMFFHQIFPSSELLACGIFRVVRDSEMEIEEEAEDLVRTFETALKRRRRGRVVRLAVDNEMPDDLREFLRTQLDVMPEYMFRTGRAIGLCDLRHLVTDDRPDLLFPKYQARFPERIRDFGGDCFAAIQAKDILVHHPYESFDVVAQFLRQAAEDPQVVAIKQTLYRTSRNSPIVQALVRAAESGKSVTAMIELKARFDEEANIEIARILERSGAQVGLGFMEMKTHAKLSLVIRREKEGLKSYAHLGTGNYHPVTAKIYTDLSYFTCDRAICQDVGKIFNYMTGYARPARLERLYVAPLNMSTHLLACIEEEIAHARAGRPCGIWAKLNALVSPDIIDALYRASCAGVPVDLVIRGICCLRPGIPGLSENIRVKSIVGRFLEHSRIVAFGNGQALPSPQARVYISSADWMPRNLSRRIEVLVPILNPTVHQQILNQIMEANLKDNAQSWIMQPDGGYVRMAAERECFNTHEFFMTNPSLSGRGSALKGKGKKGRGKKNNRSG
ncbi:RNA degradosome polyphosphate kinase [Desulfobotulus sp.]|jgi:polyphosphate kinase|uniref:RNA degradosome polyphosphate kinase n=1 Tax=Desulfobotulus sp. TaxID=1940337 RepID=UPI002A37060F|nr:RNA degradosome polyphosphate kinase [Desulfobotulus sp.]MDY0163657.1 RNA degradosome polyphosphate kinase [Desulfobotulus sp.]